jgi:hypothetical protein
MRGLRFQRRGFASSDALEREFVFTKPRKFLKPLRVHQLGAQLLHDPLFNKGTGFNFHERDLLRLRGLLPPCEKTLEEQADRVLRHLAEIDTPVEKNRYLQDLQNRNETLYFKGARRCRFSSSLF